MIVTNVRVEDGKLTVEKEDGEQKRRELCCWVYPTDARLTKTVYVLDRPPDVRDGHLHLANTYRGILAGYAPGQWAHYRVFPYTPEGIRQALEDK